MEPNNERIAVLESEMKALRSEVAGLRKEISELLKAWNAATDLVKFIKVASTIAAALAAVYVFFSHSATLKAG